MSIFFTLSALMLILAGCEDNALAVAALPNSESRTIATIYKVKTAEDSRAVECYRINTSGVSVMTTLKNDQRVEIVAVEDGLRRFNGGLWLNIYPPLSHRPTCYVNVNNLIPYS